MSLGPEIRDILFTPVRLREGYDMGEVDALLDTLADAADGGSPLAPLVERARLTRVRIREGYGIDEVDTFLERVTGLRPAQDEHVDPTRGAVVQKRRGLLARLLGREA